jgi:hypothetical protein
MEKKQMEKITDVTTLKHRLYQTYGMGALTWFARARGLNYQALSDVLSGRSRNKKVLAALEKEFNITIEETAGPDETAEPGETEIDDHTMEREDREER